MSVTLYRGDGQSDDHCLHMTHREWDYVRRLGAQFGWKPKGTGPPKGWSRTQPEPWRGRYDCNDGQLVYAADARALARALEEALVELPSKNIPELPPRGKARKSAQSARESIDYITWAAEEFIDEVILFLEAGQFRIS
jgi:hypothetical protein